MSLLRKPRTENKGLAFRPEPDYEDEYVASFGVAVTEVAPEGVTLQLHAEDGCGPICFFEFVLELGQEKPFTLRTKKVKA